MSRAVRLSLIGFGIAMVLICLAVGIFAATFDLNDYKGRIEQAVMDETGRTLTFDGDLRLSFFPGIGVELGPVRMSNAAGFGDKPMFSARSGRVTVRIIPLLLGKIRFGQLDLEGLSISLSRNEKGVANWHDLVGRESSDTQSGQEGEGGFALDVSGVIISDASLRWDDRMSDTSFLVEGLDMTTGRIYKGAPFPLDVSLRFDCARPDVSGTLTLSSKSSIDLQSRVYGHMDMKLSIEAQGKDVPGGKGNLDASVQLAVLDFNKEHAQVTGLTLTGFGSTIHVDGTLDGITDGVKKSVGTISLDQSDLRKVLAALALPIPQMADKEALSKVSGVIEGVYTPNNMHVKSLQANVDGARIVGRARVRVGNGQPDVFVRLDVGEMDLDRYLPPDHVEKKERKRAAVKSGQEPDRLLNTELLRKISIDVEAKAAKLRVEKAWLENGIVAIKAGQGIVRVSPLSANLYGGSLSGSLSINASGKYPHTDMMVGLDKVNVAGLSRDVVGSEDYSGILNFNGAASCEGERVAVMLRSLSGKLSFNLEHGRFPGVDLVRMAKETQAKEKKSKKGKVEAVKTDSTRFGSMSGTGVIRAGILKNDDLTIKAPGLRGDGQGAVILPTREIDYLLKVKLISAREETSDKTSSDMFGVMVPIRVGGTVENPYYWVSITEYVKALGGAVIGTAGAILGGVFDAVKGVGSVITGDCCDNEDEEKKGTSKKK